MRERRIAIRMFLRNDGRIIFRKSIVWQGVFAIIEEPERWRQPEQLSCGRLALLFEIPVYGHTGIFLFAVIRALSSLGFRRGFKQFCFPHEYFLTK